MTKRTKYIRTKYIVKYFIIYHKYLANLTACLQSKFLGGEKKSYLLFLVPHVQ